MIAGRTSAYHPTGRRHAAGAARVAGGKQHVGSESRASVVNAAKAGIRLIDTALIDFDELGA